MVMVMVMAMVMVMVMVVVMVVVMMVMEVMVTVMVIVMVMAMIVVMVMVMAIVMVMVLVMVIGDRNKPDIWRVVDLQAQEKEPKRRHHSSSRVARLHSKCRHYRLQNRRVLHRSWR